MNISISFCKDKTRRCQLTINLVNNQLIFFTIDRKAIIQCQIETYFSLPDLTPKNKAWKISGCLHIISGRIQD